MGTMLLEDVTAEQPAASAARARLTAYAGFVLCGVVSLAMWQWQPDTFISAQWRYSYDVGLMRRGLLGTLLDLAGGGSYQSIYLAGLALYAAAVAVGAAVLTRLSTTSTGQVDPTRATLAFALALSPAGFPFLAANLGRFDTPVLLLTATAVALAARRTSWVRVGAAAVVLAVGVLVHEAALLTSTMWASVWIGVRVSSDRGRRAGLAACAASVALSVAAVIAVRPPTLAPAEFERWLATRTPVEPRGLDLTVPYVTPSDVLRSTADFVLHGRGITWLALSVLVVFAFLLLVVTAIRREWPSSNGAERAVLAASASPLVLMFVAEDYGRWWSLTAILAGLSALWLLDRRDHLRPAGPVMVGLAVATVLVTVVAGGTSHIPFQTGIVTAFGT